MRLKFILFFAVATLGVSIPTLSSAKQPYQEPGAPELIWPEFTELNAAYNAQAISQAHGFRVDYQVAGKTVSQEVAVPDEVWNRIKSGFSPGVAGVVLNPTGEISSVTIREGDRSLWITYARSQATGQCMAMIYPSGPGLDDLRTQPVTPCGLIQDSSGHHVAQD